MREHYICIGNFEINNGMVEWTVAENTVWRLLSNKNNTVTLLESSEKIGSVIIVISQIKLDKYFKKLN